MRKLWWGFTLIELLVVITIIVVLLALVTPALDKAIYQAELVVCAAQLGGMGRAVTVYAAENRRRYPSRGVDDGQTPNQPHVLTEGNYTAGIPFTDIRPIIQQMFDIDMLLDPLCEAVDLTTNQGGGAFDAVQASVSIWWGWQYADHRQMRKIGDRFTWTAIPNDPSATEPRTENFDLLIADMQLPYDNSIQSSHPDKDGVMSVMRLQNSTENPWIPGAAMLTYAIWFASDTNQHGPVDYNYAHADNSVSRLIDVEPYDRRTFPCPERRDVGDENQHQLIPPAR